MIKQSGYFFRFFLLLPASRKKQWLELLPEAPKLADKLA